jgi:hypothetical protein
VANTITDTRTLLDNANAVTNWVDLAGTAAGTLDTEIKVEGIGSIGEYLSSSLGGILYDAGTAQNWANSVFYIRVNCGIVGLLDTKANGGFRIRFTGATASDWFEVYVGGLDSWPTTIAGGWATFVVDIEDARTAAVTNSDPGTGQNGTPPATSAIRRVGWAGVTGGTMPRMADNTWMDAMYRLPDGTAGILIQGKNGGTTDWTFEDIYTQLGDAAGVFYPAGAGAAWVALTPIEIGAFDAVAHSFKDTGTDVLWADQEWAPEDLYGITVLSANTGTTDFQLGVKTGTGDTATGVQGCSIKSGTKKWFLDIGDAGIDSAHLYGCSLTLAGALTMDKAFSEIISCTLVGCESAALGLSLFQRNQVIGSTTADGVAFITTSDPLVNLRYNVFAFSDGHAIELTATGAQESRGNIFNGFGAIGTNDAAIYNNSAALVTISVTNLGGTPTYRNGTSASTVVQNTVTLTVKVVDKNADPIVGAQVLVEAADPLDDLPDGDIVTITRSGTVATVSHTAHNMPDGSLVIIRNANQNEYNKIRAITVINANSYSYEVLGSPTTPATGTINATAAMISGVTDVNGEISSATFPFTNSQKVKGFTRKGTTSPRYVTGTISGTIEASGFSTTVFMADDE